MSATLPPLSTAIPVPAPATRPPSAGTAETLVLVGLILQIVGAAIVVGLLLVLFGFSAFHARPAAWVIGIIAGAVGGLSLVFLFCAYEYSYTRITHGQYAEAQAPTLVIGILSLFLGLIPGVLYLVGYLKLGDAIREQQPLFGYYGTGFGSPTPLASPGALTACRQCMRVYYVGQFAFCPNCGQKLGP